MHTHALAALLLAPFALAQDAVTLHSVTVLANDDVTVVYSKNFATCAHMRFSNATCTQNGPLTHAQNIFCTQGTQISVTVPGTAFLAGFGPGITVYMVHGNNNGVASPCVTVGCNGSYGTGCAGTTGIPTLTTNSDCPANGTTLDLNLGNGLPNSVAVLGLGLTQSNLPVLGCNLLINPVVATIAVFFDPQGAGTFPFALPSGSGGATFTAQAFTIDAGGPQGFAATNARRIRVL